MKKIWSWIKESWPIIKSFICLTRSEAQELSDYIGDEMQALSESPPPDVLLKIREKLSE